MTLYIYFSLELSVTNIEGIANPRPTPKGLIKDKIPVTTGLYL